MKEIKLVKLRTAPRRSSLAGDRSMDASFSSGESSFSSQGAGPGNRSFEFGRPQLRKVRTLPNGRRISEIDMPGRRGRAAIGTRVGEESVLVDLTLMDQSHKRRRTSRTQPKSNTRLLDGLDRPDWDDSMADVSQSFTGYQPPEVSQSLSGL